MPVDDSSRRLRPAVLGLLAGSALILAPLAGYLKWHDDSARAAETAASQSIQAATDAAIAMLSYRPDTVDTVTAAAADRLAGAFRDDYRQLIEHVVAPGAKQQHISTVVHVPAAASVSATADHAVVLLFVDQTTTIGQDPPTTTASSVRATLDRIGARWLVSGFDPV